MGGGIDRGTYVETRAEKNQTQPILWVVTKDVGHLLRIPETYDDINYMAMGIKFSQRASPVDMSESCK